MFLNVKDMELHKIRFDETLAPGQIDFSGEELVQGSPLHATGTAELLPESETEVRIQGSYTVEMEAQCDRCLVHSRFPLSASFDLFYQSAADLAGEVEVEIDAGEAEIGFYIGGGLELDDILREQVLLALPMQRVCSETCKGFCPVCGKNRNETACDCKTKGTPQEISDRWGALRNLEII